VGAVGVWKENCLNNQNRVGNIRLVRFAAAADPGPAPPCPRAHV